MRGQGVPGPRNGPPGDLIAVLEIADDPRFERHGDDLVYDLPVSFAQAALVVDVVLPTPSGGAAVKVRRGMPPGGVFRAMGEGAAGVGVGGRVGLLVWATVMVAAW